MRSTDTRAIEVFYERHLLPAAEALRERGVRFFPRGPEPDAESWYEAPPTGPDFRSLDASEIEAALRSLWEGQSLPELAELAAPLLELARTLEVDEEQTGDVSPFVYVMY